MAGRIPSTPLRFCPLCADIVLPNGSCYRRCQWPPVGTAIGGAAVEGGSWVESCPTDVLERTASSYRKVLGALDREICIRREASRSDRSEGLRTLLRELVPVRCPRMAASAADIERLAVAACNLRTRDARDFLAANGHFMRVRRTVRGQNAWLYKRRFCEDEEPTFVGLQSAGE